MNSRIKNIQSLFQKLFNTYGEGSQLKALIRALGINITEFDTDLTRVMKDHWINSADSTPLTEASPSPLELIGALLNIPQEKWEKNECEAYRARLINISNILMTGLTTPRTILSITAAILGCELYPHIQRIKDTSIGWAVKSGTNKKNGLLNQRGYTFSHENPSEIKDKVFDITLTDNPVKKNSIQLNNLQNKQYFRVKSSSLAIDLPEITITAIGNRPLRYPIIENRTTKELIYFAVELKKNDSLIIQPKIYQDIIEQFDSCESIYHHPWKSNYINGSAYLKSDNELIDISDKVFYIKKYAAFNEAAFSTDGIEPTFSVYEKIIKTPKIIPGESKWRFRASSMDQANITLNWWIRHCASFKIKIVRNEYIKKIESEGRIELLKNFIEKTRPAGVLAYIDLPFPIGFEYHAIDEKFNYTIKSNFQETVMIHERLSFSTNKIEINDIQELADKKVLFNGIFDVTRYDHSRAT